MNFQGIYVSRKTSIHIQIKNNEYKISTIHVARFIGTMYKIFHLSVAVLIAVKYLWKI